MAAAFVHGDAASAALYKQALSRHVVASLKEGLQCRLGRQVSQALQATQLALTEKIASVAPKGDGDLLVKVTPRSLPPLNLTFSQVGTFKTQKNPRSIKQIVRVVIR